PGGPAGRGARGGVVKGLWGELQPVSAGRHAGSRSVSSSDSPTSRATRGRTRRIRDTTGAPRAPGPVVLDRYRLARRLGTGAFGTVWMARDEPLERDVAVKILSRERIVGGRFEREARAAARLSHPAIVTLYEA